MVEKTPDENLDWNTLSNPVPLGSIDPEFPLHAARPIGIIRPSGAELAEDSAEGSMETPIEAPEAFLAENQPDNPSDEPERPPGARSEILPREESEALARSVNSPLEMPASAIRSNSEEVKASYLAALEFPGPESSGSELPRPENPAPENVSTEAAASESTRQDPGARDTLEEEFSRLRSKMEAEVEADKKAKKEAETEEATQRERLEQWMANARARLAQADADLAGAAGRPRKDLSPSLHRLVELQKTLFVSEEATLMQSANGTFLSEANPKPPELPLDPMATISVPRDLFLRLDNPAQPTAREQALMRQAAQQVTALEASQKQAALRQAKELAEQAQREAKAAISRETVRDDDPIGADDAVDAPYVPESPSVVPADPDPAEGATPRPLTRMEALTRKIAHLRHAADSNRDDRHDRHDGPIMLLEDVPERSALYFAIAAVVIVTICVLGVGLFAATQAGVFDGLENRISFLRPKMSAPGFEKVPPAAAPATAGTSPVSPSEPPTAPAGPTTAQSAAGAKTEAAALRRASQARARKASAAPVSASDREAGEGGLPANGMARPKTSNLAEIILRASVQAATNIDAENLQAMYSRYALGFPGLSGEVLIGLTVDPGGRVLEGSVISSTTGVEAFDQELLRKVLDWRLRAFPDSRPKFITVPFLFPLQGY